MHSGKGFNEHDVISQERATEILGPHDDDLVQPFFNGWGAWTRLGDFDPEYHATMTPRGRASLVYDFIMRDAKSRFEGRESEGIRTLDDYNSLLVGFGEEIVLRFKMFDQEKRPRNYPTMRQRQYAGQMLELPGMPPAATNLSIGYRLNETATEIQDIYITCYRIVSLVWSYPLYEAVPSDVLFSRYLPESEEVPMPKPIVRAKFKKNAEAEGS